MFLDSESKGRSRNCNANKIHCPSERAFCLYHLCPNATVELPYESLRQTHGAEKSPIVLGTKYSNQ